MLTLFLKVHLSYYLQHQLSQCTFYLLEQNIPKKRSICKTIKPLTFHFEESDTPFVEQ